MSVALLAAGLVGHSRRGKEGSKSMKASFHARARVVQCDAFGVEHSVDPDVFMVLEGELDVDGLKVPVYHKMVVVVVGVVRYSPFLVVPDHRRESFRSNHTAHAREVVDPKGLHETFGRGNWQVDVDGRDEVVISAAFLFRVAFLLSPPDSILGTCLDASGI